MKKEVYISKHMAENMPVVSAWLPAHWENFKHIFYPHFIVIHKLSTRCEHDSYISTCYPQSSRAARYADGINSCDNGAK